MLLSGLNRSLRGASPPNPPHLASPPPLSTPGRSPQGGFVLPGVQASGLPLRQEHQPFTAPHAHQPLSWATTVQCRMLLPPFFVRDGNDLLGQWEWDSEGGGLFERASVAPSVHFANFKN